VALDKPQAGEGIQYHVEWRVFGDVSAYFTRASRLCEPRLMPRAKRQQSYATGLTYTQRALIAPMNPRQCRGMATHRLSSRVGHRHPVLSSRRQCMAAAFVRPVTLADRLLAAPITARGPTGPGTLDARHGGPRVISAQGAPNRCNPGQPIDQNCRSERTIEGLRSRKILEVVSVTFQPMQMDDCSPSDCTEPTSRTDTVPAVD